MDTAEAYRTGLATRVVEDSDLRACGASLAEEMLKAAPDALRISKRAFDASLEIPSFELALEVEERGQILMVRQHAGVAFSIPSKRAEDTNT